MRALITIVCLLAVLAGPAAAALELQPRADLRLRQEILDEVMHFSSDPDRNWLRVRSRAGITATSGEHSLDLRLVNEHRHLLVPDGDLDWDEVALDRLAWTWRRGGGELTVGRQDIIWPGGFLMLEAQPLDGSRAIRHDAVRWRRTDAGGTWDAALIHNEKVDPLVLVDDRSRVLRDADETGLAVRRVRGAWQASFIAKWEDDPDRRLADLRTLTAGVRYDDRDAGWEAELALQHLEQDGGGDGWSFAGQAFRALDLGGATLRLGGFLYQGATDDGPGFRAPWGRWPKWSELYIYTLIGESTPGRVHVAAWENIAAPRLEITRPLCGRWTVHAAASWLLATRPDRDSRGLLTQCGIRGRLNGRLTGHLLWERLDPGAFHDGRFGLPPLTDTAHFLRWQITTTFGEG